MANKTLPPKPSADPAIVDSHGKAYSAAQDQDRLPKDGSPPPADLESLGYKSEPVDPTLPVAGKAPDASKSADVSKVSTDFGSPNGSPMLKADDKPTTAAEEKTPGLSEETPEDLRVHHIHGQSFTIVDDDKGKARLVRLGATFQVVRSGEPVAVCRIAGAFNANDATYGWQPVPGVLTTPASSHFAGIQAGDTLHFLPKGDDMSSLGRNPFEGTAT